MPQPAKQRTLSSFLVSREKLSSLPSHPNLSLPSLPPFPPGDDETPSSDLTNRRTSTLSDYRLLAVTRHAGLADSGRPELVARAAISSQASAGHYICDIFDVSDGNWKTFDDSLVRKVRHLLSTALFSLLNRPCSRRRTGRPSRNEPPETVIFYSLFIQVSFLKKRFLFV